MVMSFGWGRGRSHLGLGWGWPAVQVVFLLAPGPPSAHPWAGGPHPNSLPAHPLSSHFPTGNWGQSLLRPLPGFLSVKMQTGTVHACERELKELV